MVVEKRKRLSWIERLEPKVHLAELDGHGIHVYAKNAMRHYIPKCPTNRLRWRLVISSADCGQAPRNPVRRGNQEVAASAGWIANLQLQNDIYRIRLRSRLGQHRIQSGIENAIDQVRGCVVTAPSLS